MKMQKLGNEKIMRQSDQVHKCTGNKHKRNIRHQ